jgi:hypothetical protein
MCNLESHDVDEVGTMRTWWCGGKYMGGVKEVEKTPRPLYESHESTSAFSQSQELGAQPPPMLPETTSYHTMYTSTVVLTLKAE